MVAELAYDIAVAVLAVRDFAENQSTGFFTQTVKTISQNAFGKLILVCEWRARQFFASFICLGTRRDETDSTVLAHIS